MTNNYEVTDLFEVGNAGATIREKGGTLYDELVEPQGYEFPPLEDE